MNYILPEGFDFYAELNKNEDTDNDITCNNEAHYDNKCLISGNELNEEYTIRLSCGHSFDYIALLNDTYESKYGLSYKSHYNYVKIRDHQLRCPYCRQIQNNILPYYPELEKRRIRGVNHPLNWGMGNNSCSYKFKSGKNKGQLCGRKCYRDKCNLHYSKTIQKETFQPDKVSRNENHLQKCTIIQLRCIAKHYKLKGYSKLKKNDLIKKIIDI